MRARRQAPVFVLVASVLVCAGLTAPTARGDDTGQCLPLDEAVSRAVTDDPRVLAAQAARTEADASLSEANALWRPRLSAFGRFGAGATEDGGDDVDQEVGLSVSQRLWDYGDGRLARSAARSSRLAADHDVSMAGIDVAQETALAYLAVLEAEARLIALDARTTYFLDQQERVTAALERQSATRAELADVEASLADAQALLLEQRLASMRAASRLARNTGSGERPCSPSHAMDALQAVISVYEGPDAAADAALQQHPGLNALRADADRLEAERKRARRSRWPALEVVGSTAYAYDAQDDDWGRRDRVGLDVSIPFFAGGSVSAGVRRAQARSTAALQRWRDAHRQVREEAVIAHERITSLMAQHARRAAASARRGDQLAIAEIEYERGRRTLSELIEVRLDYEEAQLAAIDVEFALMRECLALSTLVGWPVLNRLTP